MGKISWSQVKLTYTATGRIPRESIELVLEIMEQAWGAGEPLAKKSWNSAVGCMSVEFSQIVRVFTTETELPSYGTKLTTYNYKGPNGEDLQLFDWTTPVHTFFYLAGAISLCGIV